MKKFLTIFILVTFYSVSFAEEIQWKWEKAFNSVVLISGENEVGRIISDPFDQATPDGPPGEDKGPTGHTDQGQGGEDLSGGTITGQDYLTVWKFLNYLGRYQKYLE